MTMKWCITIFVSLALLAGCGEDSSYVILPPAKEPIVYNVDLASCPKGSALSVSGSIVVANATNTSKKAGIVLVSYYDERGEYCGAGDLMMSPLFKCGFMYLSGGPERLRFSRNISISPEAVRAEIKVARYLNNSLDVRLSDFSHRVIEPPPPPPKFRMQIVSVWFLLFVAAVCMAYFCLPWLQPYILFAASCAFYSFFGRVPFFFIGASAVSIWVGGLVIERSKAGKTRWLSAVVVFNVSVLVLLKYIHPWSSIVVPLGISFYSLQAISYVWDVKRGTIPAERNPLKLALYLIFFPTVMQGPISRYGQLGAQLWARHSYSWARMQSGLELALWGFFKKMVVADRAAMLADAVFAPGATMEGFPVILGVVCYSVQIYADFSGCVDICRGICEVMGIDLIDNFKHPYFATSIKDFWRRWHISLSTWLRDYVYIPLGGNRHGAFRKYLNVLIVFGVSGIWHGVGINFFIWGLLHGLYQLFDGLTIKIRTKLRALCGMEEGVFSFRFGQRIWTFVLVSFAWIFFRAPTLSDAWSVIKRMCVFNPWTWTDGSYLKHGLDGKDLDVLVFSLAVLLVVSTMQERFKVRGWLARQVLWFRWSVYLLAFFCTLIFGVYGPGYNASQFIYMGF